MILSDVVRLLCIIAYFVIGYAIQGDYWLDLFFLFLSASASLCSEKLDRNWEKWRQRR